MPISKEQSERLTNPQQSDTAMFEVAQHFIHEPAIQTHEITPLIETVPFLNQLDNSTSFDVVSRFKTVNEALPQIRIMLCGILEQLNSELPESPEETLTVVNSLLASLDYLACEWNLPQRELCAAVARLGAESAIGQIVTGQDSLSKRQGKTHLIYFSLIEMLALGCRTNAYQFDFIHPDDVDVTLLSGLDTIQPLTLADGDKELQSKLVFGAIEVQQVVSTGAGGMKFLHLK